MNTEVTPPAPAEVTPPQPAATPPAAPAPGQVTPPAAPATPADPAAALEIGKPAAPPPPPAGAERVEYDPTGDAGLDLALEFVGNLGYGPDHPAIVAAQTGDFTALEADLKAKGDAAKGYERILQVAKTSYEHAAAKGKAEADATVKRVHEVVGGEANWKAIQAFATANADPAEAKQINAMFKAGGIQAEAAAQYLANAWRANGKAVPPAAVVNPNAAPAAATLAPLSPREFAAESAKLYATLGGSFESSHEYKSLVARRRAFK